MKTERILIIGAGGQLGSELTEHLAEKYGWENVLPTDIKEPAAHRYKNFETLDVLNQSALNSYIKRNNFSQIYHLAAVLSATGEKNPAFAWRLNMDGLFHVLEAAVNYKISKVYWPSSIAVFGPGTPKQNTPQDTVMDPTTVYGISKLAGERWCEWYHHKYGLDVRSLRYPGLIGYKSHPGGGTTDYAVDIFFKALSDKQYECFLKPDTFLPMMYMDDAIKATLDLMEAPSEKIKVRSSYNIASMSFSPEEVAKEIALIIPDFAMTYKPDFRQQIAESWPGSIDDSSARADWGWNPQFDLKSMTREILSKLPAYHFQPIR
jgi:nucleoside-diphosphate-sugar epimerase